MAADTPHRLLKEKLRETRAEVILDVAAEMLVEKGYHDTSMDEIAARTGVAKGTLYQHFPRKEDLVSALFERELTLFEKLVAQVAASHLPARARLVQILRYVYLERSGPSVQSLRLLYHNAAIRSNLLENKEQLRDRLQQVAGQIAAILEEGKAEGVFDPEISTGLMLLTFMRALWIGGHEQLLLGEQLSPDELVVQVGRIFFEGFTRK